MSTPWQEDEVVLLVESTADVAVGTVTDITLEIAQDVLVLESAPVAVTVPPSVQQQVSDLITSTEAYVGYADPGADVTDSVWRISHVLETASGLRVTWARSAVTNQSTGLVWADRLTYSYE